MCVMATNLVHAPNKVPGLFGNKKEVFFRFLVGALPPFPLLITKDGKEDWKVPHIFSLGTLVVSGRGTYLDASGVCESIMQGPVRTAYRRPESLSLSHSLSF